MIKLARGAMLLVVAAVLSIVIVVQGPSPSPARPDDGQQKRPLRPSARHDDAGLTRGVVAVVNGAEVSIAEVNALIRPREPWIGTAAPADPRRLALSRALRPRLFAAEARRLGLSSNNPNPVAARAELAQALMLRTHEEAGLSLDAITPVEVRSYYRAHRAFFHEVETVDLSMVSVRSRTQAKAILAAADDVEKREFDRSPLHGLGQVQELTVDTHNLNGVPIAIARTAMWMRHQGAVGVARTKDKYHVVHADRIHLHEAAWTSGLALRVRNFLLQERREELLQRLEDELRRRVTLLINRSVLARVVVPTWVQYAADV